MNLSIEYILSAIASGRMGDGFAKTGWEEAEAFNLLEKINMCAGIPIANSDICTFTYSGAELSDGSKTPLKVTILYTPGEAFSYITSDCSYNDGTLMFMIEALLRIFWKMGKAATCDSALVSRLPADLLTHDILYQIGDVCVNTQYGDWGIPDKPWCHSRQTVALPIKMTLIPKTQ